MEASELIVRSLEQSQGYLKRTLDGLTQGEAAWAPGEECNSIAFILWHTARVEDMYMSRFIQSGAEVYETEGWQQKLGTPARDTGGRYTAEQVREWPVPGLEVLRGYADAIREKTLAFLKSITPEKLDEVPRTGRTPAESVGALLGRMSTEIALHVGQMDYLRGMQRGLGK